MLGIIINVTSVILVHVAGDSLNKTIDKTFTDSRNVNCCMVSFVPTPHNKTAVVNSAGEYILPDNMNFSKKVIEQYCSSFNGNVEPVYESQKCSATVRSDANDSFSQTNMIAVNEAYSSILEEELISGRFISFDDMEKKSNTAVISDITAETCFGSSDPVGQYIYIRGDDGIENQFVVTGVYKYDDIEYTTKEEREQFITSNVYVCYSKYLLNNPNYVETSDTQAFLIKNVTDMDEFKRVTTNFFDAYYGDKDWGVEVILTTDEIMNIQKLLKLLTRVMTLITIVSTIVGGLGIMNVMTVSVNERTRDIGIKKAIGARSSTLIMEFLAEATILSFVSAIIGIILGLLLSVNFISIARIICNFSIKTININVVFSPPYTAVLYAMLSGIITGIIFGIYPAVKASSMNITDSIRQA